MSPRRTVVLTIAVLVAYNVARGLGLFANHASVLLLVGALVAIAWTARLTIEELGLRRIDLRRGLIFGGAALLITVVVLVVIAVIPATAGYLDDSRARVSGTHLGYELAVSILLVTVLPEEFAFRGVLLAAGRRSWSDLQAVAVSSVVFGLWHISPTLGTITGNRELAHTSTLGTVGVVAGTVMVTMTAGFLFCWLRLRSRSLVAPIVAHWSTNSVALVVAWLVR